MSQVTANKLKLGSSSTPSNNFVLTQSDTPDGKMRIQNGNVGATTDVVVIGANGIEYTAAGAGAVSRPVESKLGDTVSVKDFGAIGNGVANDTAAIQAALNSLGARGGVVHMPKGKYKTTAMLTVPTGVSLIGDGQFGDGSTYDQGATTILGEHAQSAILSLVGSKSCTISDLCLQTAAARPYPQAGLLLGRSTTASAGYHKIMRISVYGNFDVANVYSIASEDNYWEDINLWNYALGNAKHCFYTSIGNSNPNMTHPLVTSSNLDNVLVRFWITNNCPTSDASCIYLDNAEGMGSWSFFGGYCTAAGGSYVTINNGAIDGLSALGPFTFTGFSGERLAGGDPLYGFNLLAPSPVQLRGLFISGARLDFLAGTNHYQIRKHSNLTLVAPNIVIQPPEASPYALTEVFRDKVFGGILSVGREYAWAPIPLEASWINTFGAPYAPAGYCIDATGFVHFRGQVARSSAGSNIIFYLPPTVRPAYNMFFSIGVGAGTGTILVNSSTGAASLYAGTVTEAVNLTPIQFNFI